MFRNWEDFLQRDLKCLTFGRTSAVFALATFATMNGYTFYILVG